jgi:O-antigen/teichoic acid export membrane protein
LGILRHTAAILAVHGLAAPLNILAGIVVARALGAEGKGIVVLLSGLSAVLVLLAGLGSPSGLAYLYRQASFPRGTVLGTSVALAAAASAVAGLGLWAGTEWFVDVFLGTSGLHIPAAWVWIAFATVLPGTISALLDVVLVVDGEMRAYAVKNGAMAILNVALTVTLVWTLGVTGALWAQLGSTALPTFVAFVWMSRRPGTRPLALSIGCGRSLLQTGLQQYGVSLIALVAKRADAFLIAALLSVRDAGLFALPYVGFNALAAVVRAALWPTVARMSHDAEGALRLAAVTRAQVLLVAAMAAVVGIAAPWIIRLTYGPDFVEATGAVRLMLPAAILSVLTLAGNAYYTSTGSMNRLMMPAIVAVAVQLVALAILLPRFGIAGGAIAFTANQCVQGIWAVHALSKDTGVPMLAFCLPGPTDFGACVEVLRRRGVTPVTLPR